MQNPIVHFEIMGPQDRKQALQDFYSKTFGWNFNPTGDMQYGLVDWQPGEPGIGGAVDATEDGSSQVILYIGVDNIQEYVEQAKANGAEIVQDVMTIPGMVTFAQFRDPAGNVVGIVENQMPEA